MPSASSAKGLVSAWQIETPDGRLALLNQVNLSSAGPCHIALDAAGNLAVI
jgi:6-phosphogluconolactonase (cycloisomerase 2 family)